MASPVVASWSTVGGITRARTRDGGPAPRRRRPSPWPPPAATPAAQSGRQRRQHRAGQQGHEKGSTTIRSRHSRPAARTTAAATTRDAPGHLARASEASTAPAQRGRPSPAGDLAGGVMVGVGRRSAGEAEEADRRGGRERFTEWGLAVGPAPGWPSTPPGFPARCHKPYTSASLLTPRPGDRRGTPIRWLVRGEGVVVWPRGTWSTEPSSSGVDRRSRRAPSPRRRRPRATGSRPGRGPARAAPAWLRYRAFRSATAWTRRGRAASRSHQSSSLSWSHSLLGDLGAHEEQLLAGLAEHRPGSGRRLAKRCQSSPNACGRAASLPCTTSSWRAAARSSR